MKKFLLMAVGVIMLLVVSSAYYPAVSDSLVGADAPNLELVNNYAEFDLRESDGEYVLLSFWSSTDPQSRIANKSYDGSLGKTDKNVKYVAVNLDPSTGVFEEIVKIDKLNASSQYHVDGDWSAVLGDYNLRQGYVSYLINPSGVIVAQNPTIEDVYSMIQG